MKLPGSETRKALAAALAAVPASPTAGSVPVVLTAGTLLAFVSGPVHLGPGTRMRAQSCLICGEFCGPRECYLVTLVAAGCGAGAQSGLAAAAHLICAWHWPVETVSLHRAAHARASGGCACGWPR